MKSNFKAALALSAALVVSPALGETEYEPGYGPNSTAAEAADQTLGMALLTAGAEANGTLSRGTGVVSSTKIGTGVYTVTFIRDVQQCVSVASVGSPSFAVVQGQAVATPLTGGSLRIRTRNATGAVADEPFFVIVFCDK